MDVTEVLRIITISLGYLFIAFSLIPLVKSDYWFVRVFDYPRFQKFWISTIILICFLPLASFENRHDLIFVGMLLLNLIYLLSLIWEYTPFAKYQMKKSVDKGTDVIRIFIANIYQDNKNTRPCIEMIKQYDPDLVLLVETDAKWNDEVKELHSV